MLIALLSLLSLIPSLAVLIFGIWVTRQEENQKSLRRWLLVLFGAAIFMLLPFAAFARSIRTRRWEIALLLVLSSLVAVLALLMLLWWEILAHWQVERGLFSALLAAVLLLTSLIALGDAYIALLFSVLPALVLPGRRGILPHGIRGLPALPCTGFDPFSALRIPAEGGQPPSPAWMCGAELADRLRQLPGLRVLPLDLVDHRQARNCIAIRRDLGYIAILEDLGEVLCGSL